MAVYKDAIVSDYFNYKDLFWRAMLACLCLMEGDDYEPRKTAMIDDIYYTNVFSDMLSIINRGGTRNEVIAKAAEGVSLSLVPYFNYVLADLSIYLVDTVKRYHVTNTVNIYSLSIDDKYNVVIAIRQLYTSVQFKQSNHRSIA